MLCDAFVRGLLDPSLYLIISIFYTISILNEFLASFVNLFKGLKDYKDFKNFKDFKDVTFFFQNYKTSKEIVIIEIVWEIEIIRYRLGIDKPPHRHTHIPRAQTTYKHITNYITCLFMTLRR